MLTAENTPLCLICSGLRLVCSCLWLVCDSSVVVCDSSVLVCDSSVIVCDSSVVLVMTVLSRSTFSTYSFGKLVFRLSVPSVIFLFSIEYFESRLYYVWYYYLFLFLFIKTQQTIKILSRQKHASTKVLSFSKKIHLQIKMWNSDKIKNCKNVK